MNIPETNFAEFFRTHFEAPTYSRRSDELLSSVKAGLDTSENFGLTVRQLHRFEDNSSTNSKRRKRQLIEVN